jgi:hypothetical protein
MTQILSPQLAEAILDLVDKRFAELSGSPGTTQTFREYYGTVVSVTGQVASVAKWEGADADPGYAFPAWMDVQIGDRVRVRESSKRDRYIETNFTRPPLGL